MFKNLRKKIERKRDSKNIFWLFLVSIKDFLSNIYNFLHKIDKKHLILMKKNRIIPWKTDKRRVELEITSFCNINCMNCNRSVRQARTDEYMSLSQIKKFVKESLESGYKWDNINILGGEPSLHPQIEEVIKELKVLKDYNPKTTIRFITNGFGKKVNEVISKLPSWVAIINTNKKSPVQLFQSYNDAPIDHKEFLHSKFDKGCETTESCGLGLTRYGYYICGAGASIDRVFGFDLGIKKLSLLSDAELDKQRKILCKYCGHYKYKNLADKKCWKKEEEISPSWEKAYKNYKDKKPSLSLY
jgi:hypothetical protein